MTHIPDNQSLTISTMPIKATEKLTTDAKSRLIKIIEQEFANKESLFHQAQEIEKEDILTKYRVRVGFDKIKADLIRIQNNFDKLTREKEELKKKLDNIGLDENGDTRYSTRWDSRLQCNVADYGAKELNNLLKTIEKNGPTQNLKNKLITRLTLATTIGEANVIMREILGNHLIPTLKEGDV